MSQARRNYIPNKTTVTSNIKKGKDHIINNSDEEKESNEVVDTHELGSPKAKTKDQ